MSGAFNKGDDSTEEHQHNIVLRTPLDSTSTTSDFMKIKSDTSEASPDNRSVASSRKLVTQLSRVNSLLNGEISCDSEDTDEGCMIANKSTSNLSKSKQAVGAVRFPPSDSKNEDNRLNDDNSDGVDSIAEPTITEDTSSNFWEYATALDTVDISTTKVIVCTPENLRTSLVGALFILLSQMTLNKHVYLIGWMGKSVSQRCYPVQQLQQ